MNLSVHFNVSTLWNADKVILIASARFVVSCSELCSMQEMYRWQFNVLYSFATYNTYLFTSEHYFKSMKNRYIFNFQLRKVQKKCMFTYYWMATINNKIEFSLDFVFLSVKFMLVVNKCENKQIIHYEVDLSIVSHVIRYNGFCVLLFYLRMKCI